MWLCARTSVYVRLFRCVGIPACFFLLLVTRVCNVCAACAQRVRNVCVRVRFYEERERRMLEVQQEQERFKRAGKEWKEEIKPHVSTAVVPPVMALPAAIAGCWVGGTALAATTQPEYPIDF